MTLLDMKEDTFIYEYSVKYFSEGSHIATEKYDIPAFCEEDAYDELCECVEKEMDENGADEYESTLVNVG